MDNSTRAIIGRPDSTGAIEATAAFLTKALAEQDHLTLTLNDELNELQARLEGILRPLPPPSPSTGDDRSAPRPVMAPFSASLHDFNQRLMDAVTRVCVLTARLDL